jgi:hypothetical protein
MPARGQKHHFNITTSHVRYCRPFLTRITVAMLAAAAAVVAAPVFAQEGRTTFAEGEAVFISPDGTMYKSNTKVSAPEHEAALAKGANEISRGTVLYRRGGKLYNVSCVATYIGDWKGNSC